MEAPRGRQVSKTPEAGNAEKMGLRNDFPLCFPGNRWKRNIPIDVGKIKQQKDLAQRLLPFDEEPVCPVSDDIPMSAHLNNGDPATLGQLLRETRERRGLPLEQVARDTRIRVSRLREIESDDFSHFSHSSYVRMFLIDYARYLGIPEKEIRPLLPERGEFGSEGYQYLQELPQQAAAYVAPRQVSSRRRILPSLAAAAAVVVTGLVGFQVWAMIRNIDRIGLGKSAEPAIEEEVTAEPEEPTPSISLDEPQPEFFEPFALSETLLSQESVEAPDQQPSLADQDSSLTPADFMAEDSKFLFVGGDLDPNNTSLR